MTAPGAPGGPGGPTDAPLDDVERALAEAAAHQDDPAVVRRFLDLLMGGEVLVPGYADGDGFAPVLLTAPGPAPDAPPVTAVPFFTSTARLATAVPSLTDDPSRIQVNGLPCVQLWQMAVRNNARTLLNPFNPYGKEFLTAEMSDLLAGVTPGTHQRVVRESTEVLVGAPARVPDALVPALRGYLASLGGVSAARLAWIRYPDGLEGYLLVVSTDLPRETVTAGINDVAHTEGRTLDVMVEPAASDGGLAAGVAPFFPG